MANYSVNQVHQMYVCSNATSYASAGTAEGQISKVVKTPENQLYFLYNGPEGVLKSDYIDLATLKATVVDATKNVIKPRKVEISLKSAINSQAPVLGQDYILGINFNGFFSPGADSQYYKDAAVHVTSSIATAKNLFDAMKLALDKAFSREDGATASSNPYLSFSVSGSGSTAKLVIEEKEQAWALGTKKARRIDFDVVLSTIYTGGDDLIWGDVAVSTGSTGFGNGKRVADLEWFCAGEKGDQYRMVGWPNYVPTKYMVDPTKDYDLIELHYAFTDTGVNSYRTEKEITIACPYVSGASGAANKHAPVNLVIGALNSAAGSTILTAFS